MKHLYIIISFALVLMGCQDQLPHQDAVPANQLLTKAGDIALTQSDEPYVFLAQKDFKAWTDIIGLENRFKACEVPEDQLQRMSTNALVRTVLNYPLNLILSAYNNPFDALNLIIEHSPLHKELLRRSDAAETLLLFFADSYIDLENTNSIFNRSEKCLAYSNEIFLEYLLASGNIPGIKAEKNKQILQSIARHKAAERRTASKTFSEFSLNPLRLLESDSIGTPQTRSNYPWQWLTPLGRPLTVEAKDEVMTDYEIAYLTYTYSTSYPNASVHELASSQYNGNGYAWLINDVTAGSNNPATKYNSWLENTGQQMDGTLLSDEDFYEYCSASEAVKFYYPLADHSAIPYVGSSVNHISKWGNGPLMEHAPADCPYITAGVQYRKIRTTVKTINCSIVGPEYVTLNTSNAYSFQSDPLRAITVEWSAEAYAGGTSSFDWNSTNHALTCYDTGAYKIRVEGKYNNNVLFYKEKTIICTP